MSRQRIAGLIVVLLVTAGFLIRAANLEKLAGFDFDAEVAALWIRSLLVDHKLSLIGQEISLGRIYVAPFYWYFLAIFWWFLGLDPIASNIACLIVSVVTMILVFRVGEMLFGRWTGILALGLYAFSYQVVLYDRTTSTSNWLMVLSLATIYFLMKGTAKWRNVIGLGATLAMSFSVHPTTVLFIPQAAYYLLAKGVRQWKTLAIVFGLAVLGALPIFLFDIRHGFLVSRRVGEVIFGTTTTVATYPFVFRLIINLRTLMELWMNLIVPLGQLWVTIMGIPAGIVFGLWLVKLREKRTIWGLWLTFFLLVLSIYKYHVPEYYFLPVLPVILILTAAFLMRVPRLVGIVAIGVFLAGNIPALVNFQYATSLYYKKQAVRYIDQESGGEDFTVVYDVLPGQNNGFGYLFSWYGRLPGETGKKYMIVIPRDRSDLRGETFGNIKVVRL